MTRAKFLMTATIRRTVATLLAVALTAPLSMLAAEHAQAFEPLPIGTGPVVELDYSVPDRFGEDANNDGLIDYYSEPFTCTGDTVASCNFRDHTAQHDIVPDAWRVDIDACGSTAPGTFSDYSWKVIGAVAEVQTDGSDCDDYFVEFPDEGTYFVELTIAGVLGTTTKRLEVVVQDWLMIGLGDSYGSGEGNPDEPLAVGDLDAADQLVDRLRNAADELADLGPCGPGSAFDFDTCADILNELGSNAIDQSVSLIKKLNNAFCNIASEDFDLGACTDFLIEFGIELASWTIDAIGDAISGQVDAYEEKFHIAYAAASELVDDLQAQLDATRLSATWQDRRCHRSAKAAPAQAAKILEDADPRTSVTFIHLACSGAQIVNGLLGGYTGVFGDLPFDVASEKESILAQDDPNKAKLPPQVKAAHDLIGDREIDAVYISGGGNDANFGGIVTACIAYAPCNPRAQGLGPINPPLDPAVSISACLALTGWLAVICKPVFDALTAGALGDDGEELFQEDFIGDGDADDPETWRLRELYRDLQDALFGPVPSNGVGLGLDEDHADRVYLSEYVDAVTFLDNGDVEYCPDPNRPLDNLPGGDAGEAAWIDATLEQGLQDATIGAAAEFGWSHVGGIYEAFRGHGLCATDNYEIRLHDSFLTLGKILGAVHPNLKGQAVYRNRILASWLADLYPDGAGGEPNMPGSLINNANPTSPGTIGTRAAAWVADHAPRRPEQKPFAHAGGPYDVDEGSTVVLENDSYDGDLDPLTFGWSVRPGLNASIHPDDVKEPTLTGIDDSTGAVLVVANDGDEGSDFDFGTVHIHNVAPEVSLPVGTSAREGEPLTVIGTYTDPGPLDKHTATIDWGDGNVDGPFAVSGGSFSRSHVYEDNGSFTPEVVVADDDGDEDVGIVSAQVLNAPPAVEAGANRSLAEGAAVGSASYSDLGALDTHTATIAWGDGTNDGSFAVNNGTVPLNHAYADNGTYVVNVCVTDDDGATACDPVTLTVTNVDPTVAGGPDTSGAEGSPVNVAAAVFHDDGTADTHTATVSWGDGTSDTGTVAETPFGPPGSTTGNSGTAAFGTHIYADNGAYTITVCVSDDDGGEGCDIVVATIGNVSPTSAITSVGDGPAFFLPLVDVSLGATLHDAGTRDTHNATLTWGDGAVSGATVAETPFGPPGSVSGLDGTVTSSHAYAVPGLYTLSLSLSDDDGGAAPAATATVEVVSPEIALTRVLSSLRALANDPAVSTTARGYLSTAVKRLDGASTPGPPNSGALQKLRDGDLAAALLKIRDALGALDQAKVAQPSLDLYVAQLVLTQIAESVAADAMADAIAANNPPTAGEAKQLAKLQTNMLLGRTRRIAMQWYLAADAFRTVVKDAVALL